MRRLLFVLGFILFFVLASPAQAVEGGYLETRSFHSSATTEPFLPKTDFFIIEEGDYRSDRG